MGTGGIKSIIVHLSAVCVLLYNWDFWLDAAMILLDLVPL